jgi:hypothetical protein
MPEIRKWTRVSNNWGASRVEIDQVLRGFKIVPVSHFIEIRK